MIGMFLSKDFQAFMPKPIDLHRLDEVLRLWVRDKEQELLVSGENDLDRREVSCRRSGIDRRLAYVHLVGLDMEKGIKKFGGDPGEYFNILRSYVKNIRPLLESISNVRRDRLAGYAITVHGIKGASRGVFADMVGDAAESLEKAAKSGDWGFVNHHHRKFLDTVWRLINDIEVLISDFDAENQKPMKDTPDTETLSKLLAACESYDMDGVDEAVDELDRFTYMDDDGLVEWLIENTGMMNCKEVIKRLKALL
jgi:HPt (histidine-containing phosphotransfer) domain-containing protein